MRGALFNELLARLKRVDMTGLGLEKPLIKVDKRLVLHLAVAAVACAVGRRVLLRKLNLVLRALLAN